MKIYTEHLPYCCNCPSRARGYGGYYCGRIERDLVYEGDFPRWCPLPDLEEPQCK